MPKTNWEEWIKNRFSDESKYLIIENPDDLEIIIKSKDKNTTTEIVFIFMAKDDKEVLYDIQFSGGKILNKYNVWVSHFTVDPMYQPSDKEQFQTEGFLHTSLFLNAGFISRLEKEWLVIPLKDGWRELSIFIGDKVIYSKLQSNNYGDLMTYNLWQLTLGDIFKLHKLKFKRNTCKAIEKRLSSQVQ